MRALLAGLSGHRDTALFGIDPKRVELAPWRARFTSLVVGNDARPAIDLLSWLVEEVQRRAAAMERAGVISLRPGPDFPALVLVIDEWAELAAAGSQKERNQAQDLLRRFTSLGRAVGGSAILATQRPTSDTVDVGTRALLAHRLALRCGDKWQSEAILGQGNDEAARIPVSSPGWGLLTTDQGLRGIQVYDLAPERIPDFTCPSLRVEWPRHPLPTPQ
jgi:S-DNA-T family DNA segregation ATPase FtsK/SpoIIIE